MGRQGAKQSLVRLAAVALFASLATGSTSLAQKLTRFDFTRPGEVARWQPEKHVAPLRATAAGMVIPIQGEDPYIVGPPQNLPQGQLLWLRVRLRSEQGGVAQVFYFTDTPTEPASIKFPVRGGAWEELRVPLPPLGPGYRFRFDPPGTGGTATVGFLSVEPRALLAEPVWPKPVPPVIPQNALSVTSGGLQLSHATNQLGGFVLKVGGRQMAVGHTRPLIGYRQNGRQQRWLSISERAKVIVTAENGGVFVRAVAPDEDGAVWEITQRFAAATTARATGAIDVETRISVSRDRQVVFLPLLVLLPGAGSFGASKGQALLPGLEYLDNEPSSSEADLVGPESKRRVPDSLKITFPLMAIQAENRYVGLIWEKQTHISALFDSPDRTFSGGGHALGLLFPGSNGSSDRIEGSLLPYGEKTVAAGKPLVLRATFIGGAGSSVVPAVQKYVALRGLPPIPSTGDKQQSYARLAAGWLDSRIREGDRYRHAYPGNFAPQAAADAALFQRWLAQKTIDATLRQRLRGSAQAALAPVPPEQYNVSGVSHVRPPAASLVFGRVAENAEMAAQTGRSLLGQFEPDGSLRYKTPPGGTNMGRTHFAPDANGLTATTVVSVLENAAVSGDRQLIREGLRVLRALDKFGSSVPRGAQTWEVPLHTPDILASARLVRAYTLGYELTGEKRFLNRAVYWAWTGVPFVYLVNPTERSIGPYATIAVLGATQWAAPVWMGLPVQWCGLVYADALYHLAKHDSSGQWERLADGITASGLQQTWPRGSDSERQGLLPDAFALRPQTRLDVAINPGTVQANAVRLLDQAPLYDFHAFPTRGIFVHAPGALEEALEQSGHVSFTVRGWPDTSYYVLLAGLKSLPRIRINGKETPLTAPHQYLAKEGRLILRVEGSPRIEVVAGQAP